MKTTTLLLLALAASAAEPKPLSKDAEIAILRAETALAKAQARLAQLETDPTYQSRVKAVRDANEALSKALTAARKESEAPANCVPLDGKWMMSGPDGQAVTCAEDPVAVSKK